MWYIYVSPSLQCLHPSLVYIFKGYLACLSATVITPGQKSYSGQITGPTLTEAKTETQAGTRRQKLKKQRSQGMFWLASEPPPPTTSYWEGLVPSVVGVAFLHSLAIKKVLHNRVHELI